MLVSDTPIIYKILKRVATMQHDARHKNEHCSSHDGTPVGDFLWTALKQFDAIDRVRRGLCKHVQRHLILLAVSPLNLTNLTECQSNLGALSIIKQRGVTLSVFSPILNPTLLKLYELINGFPATPFHDRQWQTVALSGRYYIFYLIEKFSFIYWKFLLYRCKCF